jgi:predicted O-methyltransferase YrrM
MVCFFMQSITDQPHKRERLIGELPIDGSGDPIEPGDALPIPPENLVPSMLTERELNYLHFLAAQVSGEGRIIELGPFLGGSTRPLLAGYHAGNMHPRPILVYDRFIAPDEDTFRRAPELGAFGLEPDEDFLGKYLRLHDDHLGDLDIRQGTIPDYGDQSQRASLYPERESIDLLFVDAAKSWGVHLTIAGTFYPHLEPHAVLVHQDFGDFRTPWLVIHLYQLRACLEPMDWVRGAPTISFRCISVPDNLDALARNPADFDQSVESQDWASLIGYWSAILGENAAGLLSGHRASHALHAGDAAATIHFAQHYDRWRSTALSKGHYTSPDWSDWVEQLPGYLNRIDAPTAVLDRARLLGDLHKAYDRMETSKSVAKGWKTDAIKAHRWKQIENRLVDESIQSVILLGGGRHTRWLIESGWPASPIEIRCILDDNPSADSIGSIPVIRPDQYEAGTEDCTIVLPSSDAYEEHLIERAGQISGLGSIQIWRVYTDPTISMTTHDEIARSLETGDPISTTIRRCDVDSIDPSPRHRMKLGLDQTRGWGDAFLERFGSPSWARGTINARDGAFLWDLIEVVATETIEMLSIVEIGTASGVSTSTIAIGVELLTTGSASIHAFDILERCYFDPTRRVGDAIIELALDLADHIEIHTHTNARDAALYFEPEQIKLALIDADHRHPAAALDLLALLPVLAPGAWVVLHDIELDRIQSNTPDGPGSQSGPSRLFEGWAFNKVREERRDLRESNIGALQIPDDPFTAQRCLLDLIDSDQP